MGGFGKKRNICESTLYWEIHRARKISVSLGVGGKIECPNGLAS